MFIYHKCFKTNLFLFFTFYLVNYFIAQSPANDPNWNIVTIASEEFNNTSSQLFRGLYWSELGLNGLNWDNSNIIYDTQYPTGPGIQTGAMRIKFTGLNTNIPSTPLSGPTAWTIFNSAIGSTNWYSGWIFSDQNYPYKYGYYEIRTKLAGYPSNANSNINTEHGLMPQFWLAKQCYCDPSPKPQCPDPNTHVWDEVDILEGNGLSNMNFAINTHGHKSTSECPGPHDQDYIYPDYQPVEIDMVNTWHKIGCELMPTYMNFYFDDNLYVSDNNIANIPTHTLTVVLDLAYNHLGKFNTNPYPIDLIESTAPVQPLPVNSTMEFVIDYFRYWQLNTVNCHLDYTILNNTDLSTFPNEVRQNIDVGVLGTEVVLMNANSSKFIRHSLDFTVICDFEVPIGCELTVMPTACH